MGELAEVWDGAVEVLGGVPDAAVSETLERAHRDRPYHGTAHVLAVVREAGWLAGRTALDRHASARVTLAACAHDVVYDGRAGDDERASAEWIVAAMERVGVHEVHVERVRSLVLATAEHSSDDPEAAALNDADLAVLAAVPADYAVYVRAVRAEYAHVSDEDWRAGRAAVLSALLERPRLYATDPAHDRWEDQARVNVSAELDALRAGPPPSP